MRLQVVYLETLESPRLFHRKTLNSTQGKGATPLATKEQSCKRGAVGTCGAGGIKIILALLGGLRVWDNCLQPTSLGVGVLWTESLSSSGWSYPAEWSDFLQGKVPTLRNLETF